MKLTRGRVRHPLFPALHLIAATQARGLCPAVCGTFSELAEAAASGVRATDVVFPTQIPGGPSLSSSERDTLWELFQVPAYVLMLDTSGRVLAYECEAHTGLHLTERGEEAPVDGTIESSPCDCGRPGRRLILTTARVAN